MSKTNTSTKLLSIVICISLVAFTFLQSFKVNAAFDCPDNDVAIIVEKSHIIQPEGEPYPGEYVYGDHKLYICEGKSLKSQAKVVVGPKKSGLVRSSSLIYGSFKLPTPNFNGTPSIRNNVGTDDIVQGEDMVCLGDTKVGGLPVCLHDSPSSVTNPATNVSHGCIRVPDGLVNSKIIPLLDTYADQVLIVREANSTTVSSNRQPSGITPVSNPRNNRFIPNTTVSNSRSKTSPLKTTKGANATKPPVNSRTNSFSGNIKGGVVSTKTRLPTTTRRPSTTRPTTSRATAATTKPCTAEKQKLQTEIAKIKANPKNYSNPDKQISDREAKIKALNCN
jgi:hypothetical protein